MNTARVLSLFEEKELGANKKKRKVINGSPTNNLIFSAFQGNNPETQRYFTKKLILLK